jgi:hypothetical protein
VSLRALVPVLCHRRLPHVTVLAKCLARVAARPMCQRVNTRGDMEFFCRVTRYGPSIRRHLALLESSSFPPVSNSLQLMTGVLFAALAPHL